MDLTAAKGEIAWRWHEQAAARWHALDPYHHLVTTHWAGDFRRVNPAVAELPGIDFLCIDAYRRVTAGGGWRLLSDILADSASANGSGLGLYHKPILTTEYGAGAGAAPEACREVDLLTGAWAALVAGHAGAPMLWWWEWVDQGGRWQPYQAIRRFIQDEDLRGGRPAVLDAHPDARVWSRAWVRPGRLLGYLQDRRWAADGTEGGSIADTTLDLGTSIAGGDFRVEWWDATSGTISASSTLHHDDGPFSLPVPTFSHHLALKVVRLSGSVLPVPAVAPMQPAPAGGSAR